MAILSIADSHPETAREVVYPPAPDDTVLYVIGDIHGRRDLLERVFEAIDRDKALTNDRLWELEREQDDASTLGRGRDDRSSDAEAQGPRTSSILGPELTINGLIEARGDVRIEGHVLGDVCANRIVVGQGASIEGSLIARDVVIGGAIRGSVRATISRSGRHRASRRMSHTILS
jgi:hypothetical protein